MREIKFRGFNRKNNEWLYGFYLQNRGAHFVCPDEFADGKSWDDYEIDADTLGQFTGLQDKNGVKIFDGDIVRKRDLTFGLKFDGVVVYNSEIGCFRIHSENNGVTMRMGFEASDVYNDGQCTVPVKYDYEVIGNTFNNKNILKHG